MIKVSFPVVRLTLILNSGFLFVNPGNTFLSLSLKLNQGQQLPAWLKLNLQAAPLSTLPTFPYPASNVVISGNTIFLAGDKLQIIDVSKPSNPRLLSSFPGVGAVAISGNIAYVTCSSGLLLINVTDTSNPRLLSSLSSTSLGAIAISANLVFVTNDIQLQIIDVGNTSNPHVLSLILLGLVSRLG